MNKSTLIGRLVADPELRYSQSGKAVTSFKLAVRRNFKNAQGEYESDFIPCVAWGNPAELIANSVKKGHRLAVNGRLQVRSYDAQDGTKRWVSEIAVEEFDFLESRTNSSETPSSSYGTEVPVDDSLPF